MRALVIYDSVFGNTEQIAQAVGAALASRAQVQTLRVTDARPEQIAGLDLLVVGSPTRGFRPTPAALTFLNGIPARSLSNTRVAAFDTRADVVQVGSGFLTFMVKLFGYAAEKIATQLRKKGGQMALPPEGFFITKSEGPLREGELERAAQWAARLVCPDSVSLAS